MKKRFLLISSKAFYPIHWMAFSKILDQYPVDGFVITSSEETELPNVHKQLGWMSFESAQLQTPDVDIKYIPSRKFRKQMVWLWQQLRRIEPDFIWVQEEPTHPYLMMVLLAYKLWKRARIVSAVCENIFAVNDVIQNKIQTWLWSRLNGLLAVANESVKGIRKVGMPETVPFVSLAAGAIAPPARVESIKLPFNRLNGDFVIGFVGRVTEEKGWKILLDAVEELSESYKCVFVGDGPQVSELHERLNNSRLIGRAAYLGIFSKEDLWCVYKSIDCLVLPSLTTPTWKEQFGGVLADAMAMGLPIIGSDSGSIPEVVGPAGLIVPEGNAAALRDAIQKLAQDPMLCNRLGSNGKKRFEQEFDIPAYAHKIAFSLGMEGVHP